MNKKGQLGLGGLVIVFIGIIFCIALLAPIFSSQSEMTTKQVVTNQSTSLVTAYVGANEVNESINYTLYTQSDWKQADCPLTSVSLKNATGTALVADTDYTLYASQGVFSLLNTSSTVPATTGNVTYGYYTYCADGYNKDQGSRSVAGFIGLFAILALVVFVLDRAGIIDMESLLSR